MSYTTKPELDISAELQQWRSEEKNYDYDRNLCLTGAGSCSRYLQVCTPVVAF